MQIRIRPRPKNADPNSDSQHCFSPAADNVQQSETGLLGGQIFDLSALIMALILDGTSEIGAHAMNKLCHVIY